MIVLLPVPVWPTRASVCPAARSNVMSVSGVGAYAAVLAVAWFATRIVREGDMFEPNCPLHGGVTAALVLVEVGRVADQLEDAAGAGDTRATCE